MAAEILARLNAASFEIAHAVQHTTGQAFVMAFQAGGPHAQDRGLEAVAYAYAEQTRTPGTAALEQAPGQAATRCVMDKTFTPVGARRRPADRLQHLPHLERLSGPLRLAWSPATR